MHRHQRRHHPDHHRSGPAVEITVLGGFAVTVDGAPVATASWTRRSAAALVKILALAPARRLHREQIMDLLWPDEPAARAAPRLHKAAHYARRALGRPHALVLRADVVALFPGAEVTVDAVEFDQRARLAVTSEDPAAARDALAWYHGELLPDDRYDDWAIDRRELLHLRRLELLRIAGDWRELAEAEPTDENAHVELMRLHLAAGDGATACRQYDQLERVLERELGVQPGPQARAICEQAGVLTGASPAPTRPADARSRAGDDDGGRVARLLAELAELTGRQSAVLAELAAVGAAPARLRTGARP